MMTTTAAPTGETRQIGSPAIVARGLTKRFGAVTAVQDLSFDVRPGQVTGFLGPNGAGKSTTMRMVLGLVRPTSGSASVLGMPYASLDRPSTAVGAVLEVQSFHPLRTGRNHLRVLAASSGIAYTMPQIANDGSHVLARRRVVDRMRNDIESMEQHVLLAWRLVMPSNAEDTQRWLERLTNATFDQQTSVLGWQ